MEFGNEILVILIIITFCLYFSRTSAKGTNHQFALVALNMSSFIRSEEEAFHLKIAELGLRATYSEETKQDYGITFHRLNIKIMKGDRLLVRTSSGFKTNKTYRDNGFLEGNRRLLAIEMNEDHKA